MWRQKSSQKASRKPIPASPSSQMNQPWPKSSRVLDSKDYPRFLGLEFCKSLNRDLLANKGNGKVTSAV